MAKMNQEEFKCPICGKTFFTKMFLNEHAKIRHKRSRYRPSLEWNEPSARPLTQRLPSR
jgi:hypothetical protein